MADDFQFRRDVSHVLWKETLWHNALRAAGAGIVWGILMLFSGEPGSSLGMMVMWPVTYFVVLLPIGLIAAWLSSIPFVGLIAAFFSLLVAVGDPLVYALSRFQPQWVPVDHPDLFSLRIIIFVMSPFAE